MRHDAAAGVSESDAVGGVAEVFAQIRAVTQAPFVTSVWRVLARDEDTLRSVWERVAPHVDPQGTRELLRALAVLAPAPAEPLGLDTGERLKGAAVVRTYTVANATVMRALVVSLDPSCQHVRLSDPKWEPSPPSVVPVLPSLRDRTDLSTEVLTQMDLLDATGQPAGDPLLHATMWRHLGSAAPSTLEPLVRFLSRLDPTVLPRMIAQLLRTISTGTPPHTPHPPRALPHDLHDYLWGYATAPEITPRVVALGVLTTVALGEEF